MAIKGKGKSKRRGVATAPKPVYVQPKTPLFLRRRFWITTGIVVAVAAVASIVPYLIIHGHHNHEVAQARAARAVEKNIVKDFGTQLDNALTPVGKGSTLSSFQAFPTFASFISEFQKGNLKASIVEKDADKFNKQATDALAAVQKIQGSSMVGVHAVDLGDLTSGQTQIEHGLQLFGETATSLKLAAEASGGEQKALITHTSSLLALATAVFNQGYEAVVGLRAKFGLVALTNTGSPPPTVPGTIPTP